MKRILTILATVIASASLYAQNSVYDFTVEDMDGKKVALSEYKGKVILIVNSATRCGFTPQYQDIEELYKAYSSQGFEVLDFPCNQFGEQAPGTNREIAEFCTGKYDISFKQFSKIDVNGDNAIPLYKWLVSQAGFKGFDKSNTTGKAMDMMLKRKDPEYASKPDIKWNFTKFLIDREGKVIARFEPTESIQAVDTAIKHAL